MAATTSTIPAPSSLKLSSDIAADWERFRSEWTNYEIAADLTEVAAKKRAAVFLACVGSAAYGVFRTFKFENEDDKFDVQKIILAFNKHCLGEANITYERFMFHQRVQQPGESFDDFLADVRKLARTCEFEQLEDSLIRDRIVVGIRDEPTRRRLLQVKKLSLGDAVDACKASEATSRRLRVMGGAGEVEALRYSSSPSSRGRRSSFKPKDQSGNQRCSHCDRQHGGTRESACPAYNQRCRKCHALHHYERCCRSSTPHRNSNSQKHRQVYQIDDEESDYEELLALHNAETKRAYCHLNVNGRSVNFMLDIGATVNILPLEDAAAINPKLTALRPAERRLRMFDNTELNTLGMLTAAVQHPLSGMRRRMEFYVTKTHKNAILGIDACLEMDLIFVNEDNICAIRAERRSSSHPHQRPSISRQPGRERDRRTQSTESSSSERYEPPSTGTSTRPSRQPPPLSAISSRRRSPTPPPVRTSTSSRRRPPPTRASTDGYARPSTGTSTPPPPPPVGTSTSSRRRRPLRTDAPKPQSSLALTDGPLSKEMIVDRYADLFTGVGELEGEVRLEVDPTVPPVQMPLRRLPVPIKAVVKQELDKMHRDGIIEPVTVPSAWISALLVVRRQNEKRSEYALIRNR